MVHGSSGNAGADPVAGDKETLLGRFPVPDEVCPQARGDSLSGLGISRLQLQTACSDVHQAL
jgi:hypothetical protein